MKRPAILVRVVDFEGDELHSETRSAFNAGIRASEAAVRAIARDNHEPYEGDAPLRNESGYHRKWAGVQSGRIVYAHVSEDR